MGVVTWEDRRRAKLRHEMDRLSGEIRHSLHHNPEAYAEREPLWMAREDARRRLGNA